MDSTYWNGKVTVDGISKVGMGRNTVEELISSLIRDAVYYQAIYPNAKIELTEIMNQCCRCENTGIIGRPIANGGWKETKCPNCKGKPPTGKLASIPFMMPESTNRITLSQG